MKTSSVSARIDPYVAKRLDLVGINVSKVINKALTEASWDLDSLKEEIKEKELELNKLKNNFNVLKKERIKLDNKLIKFFKESKDVITKNVSLLKGRVKLLYGLFKIPVDEQEFIIMMNNYIKQEK